MNMLPSIKLMEIYNRDWIPIKPLSNNAVTAVNFTDDTWQQTSSDRKISGFTRKCKSKIINSVFDMGINDINAPKFDRFLVKFNFLHYLFYD